MLFQRDAKIGDIVAKDFRTARVFEQYGLDFCCGGKKTITNACSDKGINAAEVMETLSKLGQSNDAPKERFDKWTPDFLIDYIVNNHHTYVNSTLPVILAHIQKVAEKHGERHPEVIKIAELFASAKEELEVHLQKEEKMLFPYIKNMLEIEKEGLSAVYPPFGTVEYPIKVMEAEHDKAGRLFDEIRELSGNFIPPEDACNTYRVSYSELKEFEDDLHVHVHLENNILFPKAIEIERKLSTK